MTARLERIWRAFGVGLFLAVIGVGGSLLALSVFPLIAVLTRDASRRQRRIQRVVHASFKLYCRGIHWLRVADVTIEGADRMKTLSGVLIVANHPSLLDVVMIMSVVPNVQCVVKAGLWRNPFFRLTLDGAGYIPNDLPGEEMMTVCADILRSGQNLIVFPEGSRTVIGQPVRFRRGFANIATLAGADLQLVRISCDPPLLHKGNPWWRVPPRRSRFHLVVDKRLDINQFLRYRFRSLAARKLVDYLEHYYADTTHDGYPGVGNQDTDHRGLESGGSGA